jgi:hypothetical protein
MEHNTKPWYKSKTIWFFLLFLAVSVANLFGYNVYSPDPQTQEIVNIVVAVVAIILRVLSNKGIS